MARVGVPKLGRGEWRRTLLGATGLTLFLLAIPQVLFGSTLFGIADELGSSAHSGRHLGCFAAALAFGFAYAAWRPERAIGLVPLTSALGALLLVTAVVDTLSGNSSGLTEATHVLEMVGIALIWTMSGKPMPAATRRFALR